MCLPFCNSWAASLQSTPGSCSCTHRRSFCGSPHPGSCRTLTKENKCRCPEMRLQSPGRWSWLSSASWKSWWAHMCVCVWDEQWLELWEYWTEAAGEVSPGGSVSGQRARRRCWLRSKNQSAWSSSTSLFLLIEVVGGACDAHPPWWVQMHLGQVGVALKQPTCTVYRFNI